jgi:hypothetical protein
MTNVTPEKVAEWMIVGFVRCWTWKDVAAALGVNVSNNDEIDAIVKATTFTPRNRFVWFKKPIRAHINHEWPKLYEYMLRHESEPHRLLALIPQILRLKARDVRGDRLSSDDSAEAARNSRFINMTNAANKAARLQQLSTQRSAWNVCKK